MITKQYRVKISLELHAITCPGVWLCPNGGVELTLRTLGYIFRAGPLTPRFPLIYHETFTMEGHFKDANSLQILETMLGNETINISLFQYGRRLAFFNGKLGSLFHTGMIYQQNSCNQMTINTHLLMTKSKNFPGIIGPKIEISTTILVKEINPFSDCDKKQYYMPLWPCSSQSRNHICYSPTDFQRQKAVCHYIKHSHLWTRSRSHYPHHHFQPISKNSYNSHMPDNNEAAYNNNYSLTSSTLSSRCASAICTAGDDGDDNNDGTDDDERVGDRLITSPKTTCGTDIVAQKPIKYLNRLRPISTEKSHLNPRSCCETPYKKYPCCCTTKLTEIHSSKFCYICQKYREIFNLPNPASSSLRSSPSSANSRNDST